MTAFLRVASTLLVLVASTLARPPGAFTPTSPGCNGLLEKDLSAAAFPISSAFVLTWRVAHNGSLPAGAAPKAFVVDLTGSLARAGEGPPTPLTWSSGESHSARPMFELPPTLTQQFQPGATFSWKVRLWDGTAWGLYASSTFDTAPSADAWAGSSWIGGGSELRADLVLPPSPVVRARAYCSGVGAMELHLNGEKVGDHILDPGEAVYDEKVLFVSFNVTGLLHSGVNAVGARLGNSKWGYLDIYSNRSALGDQSGDSSRAFLLLLVATLADGSEHTLTSNASGGWHTRHGPIVYDHLWHGEIYDTRQELAGWSAKPMGSFPSATAAWSPAKLMHPKVGALFPQLMQPVRRTESFAPVAPPKKLNGSMAYDFGQNMAGVSTLTLDLHQVAAAAAAATFAADVVIYLRLHHTEIMHEDGSPNNNYYPGMENNHASKSCSMSDWYKRMWYECANQTDGVIFTIPGSGSDSDSTGAAGVVTYSQSFTYHGFRLITLTATQLLPDGTEKALPSSLAAAFPWGAKLTAHRAHSDVEPLSSLQLNGGGASNQLIGQIFNATIASHTSSE